MSTSATVPAVTVSIVALVLTACDAGQPQRDSAETTAVLRQRIEEQATSACYSKLPALIEAHRQLVSERRFADAAAMLGDCALRTSDESAQRLHSAALKEASRDTRASAAARLKMLDELHTRYPGDFDKSSQAAYAKLQLQETRRAATEKKNEGVRVGMTAKDILASSWGKPRSVNRDVNSRGIREQWVYDGGYLYLQDGVLTTISVRGAPAPGS